MSHTAVFTNQQIAVIGTPEPDGMPFDPGAGDNGDKSETTWCI
ncbi:MAG: hypothetical protein U5L01_03860 [Rheinheimera sp.]|nr:hypothetical protein [Rheinheimera sp.]